MKYRVVIWDSSQGRVIDLAMGMALTSRIAVALGSAWARRFPNDIVMLVEVE